ncbi:MAG: response regulator transcription factor [Clostridia bacterium]|nr:response regulator transcription factor [Clostridia bacterium]
MTYHVLIVDDQTLPRQYFESIVTHSGNYVLTAAISSAKMAYSYCTRGNVDLILMDIVMSDDVNGLEAARKIKQTYPDIRILAVTSMPDATFLEKARDAGVDSFWYKEVQDAPMLEVMDRTMAGEHIWPDSAPTVPLGMSDTTELTERELAVLRLLAMGYSNQEIAEELFVSINTIRFHLGNLLSKTGFSSRTELAITAARSGIAVEGIR